MEELGYQGSPPERAERVMSETMPWTQTDEAAFQAVLSAYSGLSAALNASPTALWCTVNRATLMLGVAAVGALREWMEESRNASPPF